MAKVKDFRELIYVRRTDDITLALLREAWEKEKLFDNSALLNEKDETLVDRALRFYIGHWLQQ